MEFVQSETGNEPDEHENEVCDPFDLPKVHLLPLLGRLFVPNNATASSEIQMRSERLTSLADIIW